LSCSSLTVPGRVRARSQALGSTKLFGSNAVHEQAVQNTWTSRRDPDHGAGPANSWPTPGAVTSSPIRRLAFRQAARWRQPVRRGACRGDPTVEMLFGAASGHVSPRHQGGVGKTLLAAHTGGDASRAVHRRKCGGLDLAPAREVCTAGLSSSADKKPQYLALRIGWDGRLTDVLVDFPSGSVRSGVSTTASILIDEVAKISPNSSAGLSGLLQILATSREVRPRR